MVSNRLERDLQTKFGIVQETWHVILFLSWLRGLHAYFAFKPIKHIAPVTWVSSLMGRSRYHDYSNITLIMFFPVALRLVRSQFYHLAGSNQF